MVEDLLLQTSGSKEALSRALDVLYDNAYEIAEQFWVAVNAHEKAEKRWEHRSALQLTCTKRNDALIIHWASIEWRGATNKRFKTRTTLRRLKDGSYSEASLRSVAQDWEIDMALKTERKLFEIRKIAAHLNKCLLNIRNTEQAIRTINK